MVSIIWYNGTWYEMNMIWEHNTVYSILQWYRCFTQHHSPEGVETPRYGTGFDPVTSGSLDGASWGRRLSESGVYWYADMILWIENCTKARGMDPSIYIYIYAYYMYICIYTTIERIIYVLWTGSFLSTGIIPYRLVSCTHSCSCCKQLAHENNVRCRSTYAAIVGVFSSFTWAILCLACRPRGIFPKF